MEKMQLILSGYGLLKRVNKCILRDCKCSAQVEMRDLDER